MGFDLYGESGAYFRASVWEWPAIHALIAETGVLAPDVIEVMATNNAAKATAEQAEQIAAALEERIDSLPPVLTEPDETPVWNPLKDGTLAKRLGLDSLEGAGAGGVERDGKLREFIEFCRASGGFRVS